MIELPRESTDISSAFVALSRKSALAHRTPFLPPVQHHAVPFSHEWASVVIIRDPAKRAHAAAMSSSPSMTARPRKPFNTKTSASVAPRQNAKSSGAASKSKTLRARPSSSSRSSMQHPSGSSANIGHGKQESTAREISGRKRLGRLRRQEEHRRLKQ
ncbi:uncharacterized protein SCHCODRAFT_02749231 [Schizophyllum commune H4-8]|uniref:Expressed protein n=1 Tax=Schizophyllum commune (strain H4-8 / FGSC 9210) TaxID=578458 RepID=D8Q677_SCHCM|nr:uncharacterized protein SCHCODRAFT_02504508 [Schizophyllum commune H4-8]XP_050199535.1 uncharacterized protein SCHCODRAFT_02749231 [Schizophyllum commune H4-8]KAI5891069.1 hypothetical protein SCHCODRAFT_02504508 [Schizophyllum commune H4-8]KAI5891157.1 hypothetical protein SCHCODRAFT_02749231 [Schizophyllum commune H4-8]